MKYLYLLLLTGCIWDNPMKLSYQELLAYPKENLGCYPLKNNVFACFSSDKRSNFVIYIKVVN